MVGNRTRVKVVKNKVAPPFKETEFDILYNEGISKVGDMLDVAIEHGIVQKSGSWLTYKEDRVQGRDGLRKLLQDTPVMFAILCKSWRWPIHVVMRIVETNFRFNKAVLIF